jgi:hypothetical protein
MAGEPQPLDQGFAITNADGTPTQYFILWAQDRQIDIQNGITAAQAQQLIDDWAAERDIIAGTGLDGGGPLSLDVTIDLADTAVTPGTYGDATNVPQITVDQQGRITDVVDVPISGGGGGYFYNAEPVDIPALASFTALNPGTGTASDNAKGIAYLPQVGNVIRGYKETTYPGVPFTRYYRASVFIRSDGASTATIQFNDGFILRNSSNGRLATFLRHNWRFSGDEVNLYTGGINRFTNYTTFSASAIARYSPSTLIDYWLKLEVTSTNATYSMSPDGTLWTVIGTETFSTFLTAAGGSVDEVGFYANSELTGAVTLQVYNYGGTAP